VIIGSRNPIKIQCTEEAFELAFGKRFMVQGLNVGSGVGKQPIGDSETYEGAFNRAFNSKVAFPEADYWVGIEGGAEEIGEEFIAFAWIVITDRAGKIGKAKTAAFFLPEVVRNLVKQGMELGEADDQVFNIVNSKQDNGAVGILTNGVTSRKDIGKR
jgi:inosine/xanthosine triphosphatase